MTRRDAIVCQDPKHPEEYDRVLRTNFEAARLRFEWQSLDGKQRLKTRAVAVYCRRCMERQVAEFDGTHDPNQASLWLDPKVL